MKLNEITQDHEDVLLSLRDLGIRDKFTVNSDNSVNIDGHLSIVDFKGQSLDVKFKDVFGSFTLNNCPNLNTLEGAPIRVNGNVVIHKCASLKSLDHFPKKVAGVSTIGELNIEGEFDNPISSLKGLENCELKGSLVLANLKRLKSLQHCLVPGFNLTIIKCGLETLEHCPKLTNSSLRLQILHDLKSFDGIKELNNIDVEMVAVAAKNYLAFLKTRGKFKIDLQFDKTDNKVADIINKHLKGDRDIIDCQEELIEAGLKQYARLK